MPERKCQGSLNPGRVLDFEIPLDEVAEAYAAMDERRAIKSLLRGSSDWRPGTRTGPPRPRTTNAA